MFRKFLVKRARAQLGTLSTILAISFISALILSGSLAFIAASTSDGIAQQFSTLNPLMKVQQYQTQLRDHDQQRAAAEQVFAENFPANGFDVHQQIRSYLQEYSQIEAGTNLRQVATPDLFSVEWATLLSGEWPESSGSDVVSVALSESSAEQLQASIGDELLVATTNNEFTVRVAGIYQPLQTETGYWVVSDSVSSGVGEPGSFPVVYSATDFSELFSTVSLRFTLVANPAELDANAVDQIVRSLPRVHDALRTNTDFSSGRGASSGGGVFETLNGVQDALVSVRAVTPVPILLIVMLSLIGLSQLTVLLNTARHAETVLLKSRGFNIGRLGRANLFEALLFTVPVGVSGAMLAIPVMALVSGTWVYWFEPLIVGLLVGLVGGLIVYFTAQRELKQPLNRETGNDSGRVKTALRLGLVVIVAAVTAYSLWQFKLHGSAMIVSKSGEVSLDWVSLFAPVLIIFLLTLLALVFIGPLSRMFAAFKHRKITGYLSTVQVSRRIPTFTVSFSLIVLAVASIVFAASYAGTWRMVNDQQNAIENPTRTSLSVPNQEFRWQNDNSMSNNRSAPDGLLGMTELNTYDAFGLEVPIQFLAVEPSLSDLLTGGEPGDGRAELAAFAEQQQSSGIEISQDVTAIEFDLTSTKAQQDYIAHEWYHEYISNSYHDPAPADVNFLLWLVNDEGQVQTVTGGLISSELRETAVIELPPREGTWYLARVHAHQHWGSLVGEFVLDWHGLSLHRGEVITDLSLPGVFGRSEARIESWRPDTTQLNRSYYLGRAASTVPALVPEAMREALGLKLNEEFELSFTGSNRSITVVIAATTPTIPGTTQQYALAVPMVDYQQALLQRGMNIPKPNLYWFEFETPDQVPPWLSNWNSEIAGSDLQIGAEVNPLIYASVVTAWFGAGGIIVLALTALIAVTTVLSTTRRPEIPIFRALGLSAAQQARIRFGEMALVTGLGLLFGAIIGLVASWLTVPEMAASTMLGRPEGLVTPLQLDFVIGGAFLAVLFAGLLLILGRYAQRTRQQALDTEYREETR